MFAPSAIELSRSIISFKNEENINNSITKNISLKYKLAKYKDLDKLEYNNISREIWEVSFMISWKIYSR